MSTQRASLTEVKFHPDADECIAAARGAVESRFPWRRGTLFLLACMVLVQLACQKSPAQQDDGLPRTAEGDLLPAYEGQVVSSIGIAGRPDFDAGRCPACLVQRTGQPFSREKVDETANALKAAGNFSRVEVEAEPDANGVRIVFVLEPAVYVGIFTFPGARQFPYSQLIQAAHYPIQDVFNPSEIRADQEDLTAFFRQEGYFGANVDPRLAIDSTHAVANLHFDSTLGRRAKFGSVVIENAPGSEGPLLAHSLTTFGARLHSAAIRPGRTYHRSTVDKATNYLRNKLEKEDYLDAQVKLSGAEYDAATNRADIHFSVRQGPRTEVRISGAHLWPWKKKSLLPVYQGVGVDDEIVAEGRQALVSWFQAKGYFDVKVESQLKKQSSAAAVLYTVTKEKKHRVTSVSLTGNADLPSARLKPQIAVERKHLFSPGKFSDQLVEKSAKNLEAVYQSEGWSHVRVTSATTKTNGDIGIAFRVVEGPRDIVNSLTIEGVDTIPRSQFAPKGLELTAGSGYSQAHVQSDRAGILANYLKAGYLIASFRETASQHAKTEPHRIDVVYHIVEGPRVTTGNVLTLGRDHARQRMINNDVKQIRKGQPLTESELLIGGSNLYNHTGVFDWAEVDPKEPVTTQNVDDVLVKVHESNRNEFTYGFGFEVIDRGGSIPGGTVALPNLPPIGLPSTFTTSETTFWGPRGTFQYTRNDLFGKGQSVSVTGFAGRLDQRGAFYYIDPDFRWSSWKSTASFSVERNEENPIFSSQEEQETLQFQRPVDKSRKTIFFAQYGFSQVDLTRVLIPSLVPAKDQHVRLSTVSANITRDTRDNPLDEHKGALDSLELDFNDTRLGSSVSFAKLTGQAAIYREKLRHIVWAESLRIGLAQPFANSFVPLSEAFFSGGGNSLRGFPLDGAGPQRQVQVCSSGASNCGVFIQVPGGGNELLLLNSEARIPLPVKKGLSLVAFYDGGNVFPSAGFHDFTSLYSNNVGLGLRYSTPVGPVRIDVGRNLNPVAGINATQYFIGIGQAF